MGAGSGGIKVQKLMEERAPAKWMLFHAFCDDYWYLCCLTLLPIVVGWYIMSYEEDTPPSYNYIMKCSYSVTLH